MRPLLLAACMVFTATGAALAQDPATAHSGQYHVVLDNPEVRVLHVMVKPGEKNAMHDHPDHLAVMLTDSKVRFAMPDGTSSDLDGKIGDAVFVPAGKHAGENTGAGPLEAIIVELKGPQPPKATLPPSRPGIKSTSLVDNPRVAAVRATADPTFSEPAGTTHDYSQVVIALGAGDFTLSVDGKATSTWKKGEARYIGRGVAHESKNTGGKPLDFVIVAIK
jgi:quercetin dioxygenase-like cupin family protein